VSFLCARDLRGERCLLMPRDATVVRVGLHTAWQRRRPNSSEVSTSKYGPHDITMVGIFFSKKYKAIDGLIPRLLSDWWRQLLSHWRAVRPKCQHCKIDGRVWTDGPLIFPAVPEDYQTRRVLAEENDVGRTTN